MQKQLNNNFQIFKDKKIFLDGQEFIDKYGFECPLGVKGRNSHNKLYIEKVGWETQQTLENGMISTYSWIKNQVEKMK